MCIRDSEKGSGVNPKPLLLSHGWPGSIIEFLHIIDQLAHPEKYGGKEEDGFDNVDEFRADSRFKIIDIPYGEAKGLPYARGLINDELLTDEDYLLQLDSHHRFDKNWDDYLIRLHNKLLKKSNKVIIGGYLPYYDPFNDPAARVHESWQTHVVCFYPHGTCFVRALVFESACARGGLVQQRRPHHILCGPFCIGFSLSNGSSTGIWYIFNSM